MAASGSGTELASRKAALPTDTSIDSLNPWRNGDWSERKW